jgi:hypothetical protein
LVGRLNNLDFVDWYFREPGGKRHRRAYWYGGQFGTRGELDLRYRVRTMGRKRRLGHVRDAVKVELDALEKKLRKKVQRLRTLQARYHEVVAEVGE